jgi:hypothetical protein
VQGTDSLSSLPSSFDFDQPELEEIFRLTYQLVEVTFPPAVGLAHSSFLNEINREVGKRLCRAIAVWLPLGHSNLDEVLSLRMEDISHEKI